MPQDPSPLQVPLEPLAWLEAPRADALLSLLLEEVPWERHTFRIFGQEHVMPRGIAWYGKWPLAYSGLLHAARPLPAPVQQLADELEALLGQPFNGVLLNLYRDGSESMGWHSDDDFDAGPHGGIASVSLGATRTMRIRARRGGGPSVGLALPHGSLLWMPAGFQELHQHAIPRTRKPVGPRVNLTFRWMERPRS